MKKVLATIFAAAGLCLALAGCNAEEMGSLRDLSRPYTGVYRCRKLSLGGEDMLQRFEDIRLELGYGGEYRLTYRTDTGGEGGSSGSYELNEEEGTITLHAVTGGKTSRYVFPYEDGRVAAELLFGGKLLLAEFSMVE